MPACIAAKPAPAVVAHVTWTPGGAVGPVRLRRRDAEADLLAAPDALIGQVRADGSVVSSAGSPIAGAPRVELPAVVYLFEQAGRELVTLIAALRGGRYEVDRAPATSSRAHWTPVPEGTALFATQVDATRAGEVAYKLRRGKRPAPLFTV